MLRGVIHGSWCDFVATRSWSLHSLWPVLPCPDRVVCRDRVGSSHFVTARVHSAPLRALRTMPVDTRKITYAAGTQPASRAFEAAQ